MSSLHRLISIQKIPAGLKETWKFFSDPANLLSLTPPFLNLKMTNEVQGTEAYAGQVITYRVKPLFGWPLFWMTEIKAVEKEKFFVDEQRLGPYRIWHHEHHFQSIEGGVQMTDLVHYALPLGFVGSLAHRLMVKRKLEQIFLYRYERVTEIFGSWPGAVPELRIT